MSRPGSLSQFPRRKRVTVEPQQVSLTTEHTYPDLVDHGASLLAHAVVQVDAKMAEMKAAPVGEIRVRWLLVVEHTCFPAPEEILDDPGQVKEWVNTMHHDDGMPVTIWIDPADDD